MLLTLASLLFSGITNIAEKIAYHLKASPMGFTKIGWLNWTLGPYVKFAETVRHFASIVLAILIGFNSNIVCY